MPSPPPPFSQICVFVQVRVVEDHAYSLDARLVSLTKAVYALIPQFGIMKLNCEQVCSCGCGLIVITSCSTPYVL